MKGLVLGLGNELLCDDGVGILAARRLKDLLGKKVDVVESSLSGLSLFDLFLDYDRAVVIDAVKTHLRPPGTVTRMTLADLGPVAAPSPHYAGLPEMIALANRLEVDFPEEVTIYAMEVVDPYTIGGELSPPVVQAIEDLVRQVVMHVGQWQSEESHA